jgi:hypothetical protein
MSNEISRVSNVRRRGCRNVFVSAPPPASYITPEDFSKKVLALSSYSR